MDLKQLRRELAEKGHLYLRVKVTASSGRSEIVGNLADGTLKIRLRSAPERGRANAELCELMAEALGVSPKQVEILRGAHAPLKTVLVRS